MYLFIKPQPSLDLGRRIEEKKRWCGHIYLNIIIYIKRNKILWIGLRPLVCVCVCLSVYLTFIRGSNWEVFKLLNSMLCICLTYMSRHYFFYLLLYVLLDHGHYSVTTRKNERSCLLKIYFGMSLCWMCEGEKDMILNTVDIRKSFMQIIFESNYEQK